MGSQWDLYHLPTGLKAEGTLSTGTGSVDSSSESQERQTLALV